MVPNLDEMDPEERRKSCAMATNLTCNNVTFAFWLLVIYSISIH